MSSGFSYPQPIFISPIYNPSFYLTLDSNGYLTYQYAQSLYFSKNDYRLTYITGITPGTAVSGRALVLDDTGSIATISSLTATNITGTLLTASQPNITSIGALTSLTATNITGTLLTASQPNITSLGTLTSLTATNITGTLQTAAQTNITSLGTLTGLVISGNLSFPGASRTITGLNSLTSTNINGTIITAAQANITSIGTLSSLTLDMAGVGLNIPSLRFNGINFNSNYYLNITLGSATASQALVLNASKGITGLGYVSGDTLNATTLVSGTSGDFGSLSINSISVISSSRTIQNIGTITTSDTIKCSRASSAQTFNSTNGTSTMALYHFVNGDGYFGSTSSNDFVLQTNNVARMRINGSTGAISGITNLTASGTITANSLAGFLTYGNQTAITTVGPLTEFGINTTATTEYFAIKGSGSAYLDGTYTRMCRFLGSNATPVEFQIEVNNGSYGTSTNATWIGNNTANDHRFGTGSSTQMTLKSSGLLGIGTTTPLAGIHCTNQSTFTWGAGGFTVYRLRTDSGVTESTLGPITYSVMGGIFAGYLGADAIVMSSDRRLKQNIRDVSISRIKPLYE